MSALFAQIKDFGVVVLQCKELCSFADVRVRELMLSAVRLRFALTAHEAHQLLHSFRVVDQALMTNRATIYRESHVGHMVLVPLANGRVVIVHLEASGSCAAPYTGVIVSEMIEESIFPCELLGCLP